MDWIGILFVIAVRLFFYWEVERPFELLEIAEKRERQQAIKEFEDKLDDILKEQS